MVNEQVVGDARVIKSVYNYAYNLYGYAGTYNGVTCGVSTLAGLNNILFHAYDDGQAIGICEATSVTFQMPSDYQTGSNYTIAIHWTGVATTGDVVWGIGSIALGDGDVYSTATRIYNTTTDAKIGTSYGKQETELSFSGTGVEADDDIAVIVYRDADNGADTMSGDAIVSMICLYYTSNKLGTAI